MKRDWDVIRDVLLEVESLSNTERLAKQYGTEDDPDEAALAKGKMALLLYEAGYLSGTPIDLLHLTSDGLGDPDLTWAGHDLLDTLRSKPVWERIKTTAKEKGLELTFDVVKGLGKLALDYVIKQGG